MLKLVCDFCSKRKLSFVYFRCMHIKRTVLSLVLLLSYSLGFAHNLLPHCSNPDQFSHNHHQLHEHHSNAELPDSQHEHIAHANHEDEGIYDFLLCLLSDVDHHYHDELNTDFTFSKISEVSLDFIKVNINAVLADDMAPNYYSSFLPSEQVYFHYAYSIPLVGHLRDRGPPQLS